MLVPGNAEGKSGPVPARHRDQSSPKHRVNCGNLEADELDPAFRTLQRAADVGLESLVERLEARLCVSV